MVTTKTKKSKKTKKRINLEKAGDHREYVLRELTCILEEMETEELECLKNALDIFNTTNLFLSMGRVSYENCKRKKDRTTSKEMTDCGYDRLNEWSNFAANDLKARYRSCVGAI